MVPMKSLVVSSYCRVGISILMYLICFSCGDERHKMKCNPRRQNVTTSMAGIENGHIHKNLTRKMVNPKDTAWEHRRRR